ncbi:Transmembrane and coiled-coil domain-containing protein 6 [Nibea albiflora]|uniref:Transmembrane and coiled-coil domain-containing protein 6 n=1 Tax=Nibea albiflora TaxID=240163 RepID=A0ACB7ERA8_NIBAL|nr:Transmembrane and coiled-coil domain-containing protein 6 [Nibea albiflora]
MLEQTVEETTPTKTADSSDREERPEQITEVKKKKKKHSSLKNDSVDTEPLPPPNAETPQTEKKKTLRQARRDRQLVSKRLLLNEDEDQPEVTMDTNSGEQGVVGLFHTLQQTGSDREARLKALSKALRDPSAQLTFIKQENSMHLLVGFLTGSNATCRLQAVRCLHELSHSPHTNVAPACLPATPYLLTYLSGQSTKFTELCLYTLGNLCPDSDVVKEKLLAQGIIPALANCIELWGSTLSQLLQAKDAGEKIIPMVLASSLPSHLLSVLTPDPDFGLAPAIECAWCLHYLTCSMEDNRVLLAHGALLKCSSLLVSLGAAVAEGNKEEGMELLICPLLRCVGNLLSSCPVEDLSTQVGDVHIVVALCALLQAYLQTQPALARESAWVLNNLTAYSSPLCSALLTFNLVPGLIQLLPFSQGINTMILRVLANIAHKKKEFCVQLAHLGLLSALCATLKMADQEMVTLSMDVLFMLVVSGPQVAEEFVRQGGLSLLEAIQYNSEGDIRRRATHLLEHHLLSFSVIAIVIFGCAEFLMGIHLNIEDAITSYRIYIPLWQGFLVTVSLAMYIMTILGIVASLGYRIFSIFHILFYRMFLQGQLLAVEIILFISSSVRVSASHLLVCRRTFSSEIYTHSGYRPVPPTTTGE